MQEVRLKRFISSGTALRIRKLGLGPWLCLWTPFTLLQTTELMDPCVSTATELDSLPKLIWSFLLFFLLFHHPLPPCLLKPLTTVADTWLDSPLSTLPIPPHQSCKQAATQLKNSLSLQSKPLSPLTCGPVPLHDNGIPLGSLLLQPDPSSS